MLIGYCCVSLAGAVLNLVCFWSVDPLLGLALTPFAASLSMVLASVLTARRSRSRGAQPSAELDAVASK
jgi:hypothetical protein